jgi:hypothetical protein
MTMNSAVDVAVVFNTAGVMEPKTHLQKMQYDGRHREAGNTGKGDK